MPGFFERFRPHASRKALSLIAGIMWAGVGIMLTLRAVGWLRDYQGNVWLFAIPGLAASLLIHHFGFMKMADRNLDRISHLPDRPCVFSFISGKSYLIIAIMVSMGIGLRHSPVPRQYLSVVYLGIGLALFLSGIRYFRKA